MNNNDLLLRQCDALIYGYLIRRQYSSAAQYLKAESPSLRGLQPTKEGVLVLNDTVYHKNLEEIVHSFTSVGRFDVPAELIDVGAQLRNLANQVSMMTSVQPQAYSTAQHMLYGRKVPSASPSASNKKQSNAGHHFAQSLASHDTNPTGMQQYLQPQHSHVQQHHPHMQQNVHHQSRVPSRAPTPHKMQANPVQQQQQQQQFLDVSFGGGYEQQQKGGGDVGSRQEMSKTKTGETGKLNESNMSESGTGTSRRKATVPQSRSERIAHAAESAASIIQMDDLISSQSVSLISNIDDGAFNNLRHLVDVNNIHECLETLDTFPFNEDLFEDTALLDDPPLASFPNDMMGRPPTAMLNEQRNVLDVPMDDNNMSRAPPPVQPSHATPLERASLPHHQQQQQQQPRFTAMPVQRRASPVLVAPKKGSREETEKRHSNTESAFPSKSYEKRIGSPKRRNPPGQSRLEGATLVSGGGKRKEPPSINDLFGDDAYDKRDLAIEKQKNRDREQRERERRKEEMERERKRERDKDIRRRERDGESMSAIARERERRARAKEQREREQKEKEKRERAEGREASVSSSSRRGSLDSTNGGGRVANKEDSYRSEIEARDAHRKKMKEERDRKIEENRVKHEELSRQKREKEAEAARAREQKRKEEEAAAKEKKAKEAHAQRMEEEKRKREEDKAKEEEEKKKATEKRNNLFSQSLKSKQAPMEVEMTETDKTSHLFGSLSDVFEIESDESETEIEKVVDVRKRKLNKTVPVSDKEKREREKEREKDQSKGAKKTRRPLSAASNPGSIRIALNTSSSSSLPPSTSTRKPPTKPVPKSKVAQDQLYQALFAHPVKVASAVPPKPSPKRNDSSLAVELGMCSGLPPKKNVPNRLVQVNTHSARLGMLLAKWKTMKTEVAEAAEKAAEEAANKKKHNESEKKKPVQESGMAALDKIMNGEEEERECVAEEERQRKALSMTPRRAARFAPIKGPPNASTDEQENNQPSRTSRRLCAGGEVVGVDMAVERDGASSEDRETADEETNQGDAEPASKKGKFTTDEINSILDTIHKK